MKKSLKGSLLVASPSLTDPNFVRTVVFIAEHNEEGAFGLVLNRPRPLELKDLWANISQEPCSIESPTFYGGPVQENAVTFLHGYEDLVSETPAVVPGVFLGSDVDLLRSVLHRSGGGDTGASNDLASLRVFCGYSGWGPGQLDSELETGGWLTLPASAELVFTVPPEKLWRIAMELLGGAYRFFALMPPDPELN